VQLFGERARNIRARADLALKVTLGEELLEGVDHGVARDAEFLRYLARGLKARPRREQAREDRFTQRVIELTVERRFGLSVKRDQSVLYRGRILSHDAAL
jgi:hypothetical protein